MLHIVYGIAVIFSAVTTDEEVAEEEETPEPVLTTEMNAAELSSFTSYEFSTSRPFSPHEQSSTTPGPILSTSPGSIDSDDNSKGHGATVLSWALIIFLLTTLGGLGLYLIYARHRKNAGRGYFLSSPVSYKPEPLILPE